MKQASDFDLTIEEAAPVAGISPSAIRKRIDKGLLSAWTDPKSRITLLSRAEVEAVVRKVGERVASRPSVLSQDQIMQHEFERLRLERLGAITDIKQIARRYALWNGQPDVELRITIKGAKLGSLPIDELKQLRDRLKATFRPIQSRLAG